MLLYEGRSSANTDKITIRREITLRRAVDLVDRISNTVVVVVGCRWFLFGRVGLSEPNSDLNRDTDHHHSDYTSGRLQMRNIMLRKVGSDRQQQ